MQSPTIFALPGPIRRTREIPARRCRDRWSRMTSEIDTRYLDEDGDGVLDGVEITERLVVTGPGVRNVVSSRRVRLSAVDDAGVSHRVAVESVP